MYAAILEKIPVLIAGILFAIAFVIIYFRSKNVNRTEFTLIFKTANYFNLWVLIIAVLLTGVFGIFNHLNLKQSVHAIISLNYSEASQAQNSNGTRYNMAEIICDEVVEKAIKKGALEKVSVKHLRDCLTVYPCVQGGVGDESEYHISTEFAIEYHASKYTSHLDSENVIKLITAAYKEYYIERYTDNFSLGTLKDISELKKMEYMDVVAYFEKESMEIMNYLYGMAEKAPSYVTGNNTTFNSIAGKVHQFRENQLDQNLRSLILQNSIVKDSKEYLGRLYYHNKNTDFDRMKNLASYNLCNEAIEMYAEEMTRVVLVPTWDQTGKYYMGRTKVGIDELSVQATNFSDNVASNEKSINDNNLLIEKMGRSSTEEEIYQSADLLIESIYQSIKDFEREAISAGREYASYKMNQCIAVSIYGISFVNEIKSLAGYFILAYLSLMLFNISAKFPKKS